MTKIISKALAVAVLVGAVVLIAPALGAICGGLTAIVVNWWFPYVGAKAVALTGTASVWQAGVVLGFFSGFIKATLTTTKKG